MQREFTEEDFYTLIELEDAKRCGTITQTGMKWLHRLQHKYFQWKFSTE